MTVHTMHTPEKVAEMLNVSLRTLVSWRAKGIGPKFIRMNGERAIRYADHMLAEWQQDEFDRSMG
jgi:DNA-binding transcriptional MerR regulator